MKSTFNHVKLALQEEIKIIKSGFERNDDFNIFTLKIYDKSAAA